VLSVIAAGSSTQIIFGIIMAVIFIKLYGHFAPYQSDQDDFIQELSQYQIFITLLATLLIKTGASTLIFKRCMDMTRMLITHEYPYASTNTIYMYVLLRVSMYTDAFTAAIWSILLDIVIIVAMLASSVVALYFIWKEISQHRSRSGSQPPTNDEEKHLKVAKKISLEESVKLARGSSLYAEYAMNSSFDESNPQQMSLPRPTLTCRDVDERYHGEYFNHEKEGIHSEGSTGGTFHLDIQREKVARAEIEEQSAASTSSAPWKWFHM
jgi:hypothetical protein